MTKLHLVQAIYSQLIQWMDSIVFNTSSIMGGNILEHQQTAGVIKMMFGSMVTMLLNFSYGCIQSYFTTGLPKLMKANQMGILLDLYQMSWISRCLSYLNLKMIRHYLDSMVQLSQVMGIFFSGFLSDKIGRKKSLIAASLLTLMSAFCVYFCTSFLSLATVLGLSTFFSSMVQVNIFFIK